MYSQCRWAIPSFKQNKETGNSVSNLRVKTSWLHMKSLNQSMPSATTEASAPSFSSKTSPWVSRISAVSSWHDFPLPPFFRMPRMFRWTTCVEMEWVEHASEITWFSYMFPSNSKRYTMNGSTMALPLKSSFQTCQNHAGHWSAFAYACTRKIHADHSI